MPVVADAGIATVGVGDGRMISLLILDTSKRPDIEGMVKAHHAMEGQGDVTAQWGRPDTFFDEGIVSLILPFEKPSYCLIILRLDIGKYGGLVDQIIRSQGVYIQPGRPGDRLSTAFDNPACWQRYHLASFSPSGIACFGKPCANAFSESTGWGDQRQNSRPRGSFPSGAICHPNGSRGRLMTQQSSVDSNRRHGVRRTVIIVAHDLVRPFQGVAARGATDALCFSVAATGLAKRGRKPVKSIVSAFGRTTLCAKTFLP